MSNQNEKPAENIPHSFTVQEQDGSSTEIFLSSDGGCPGFIQKDPSGKIIRAREPGGWSPGDYDGSDFQRSRIPKNWEIGKDGKPHYKYGRGC